MDPSQGPEDLWLPLDQLLVNSQALTEMDDHRNGWKRYRTNLLGYCNLFVLKQASVPIYKTPTSRDFSNININSWMLRRLRNFIHRYHLAFKDSLQARTEVCLFEKRAGSWGGKCEDASLWRERSQRQGPLRMMGRDRFVPTTAWH